MFRVLMDFAKTFQMKSGKRILVFITLWVWSYYSPTLAQVNVEKTFEKPVLMHYMPWFNTPEYNGSWGWHWTMNNQDPDEIIDEIANRRQIASHYYPLIGPYASIDPTVIDYHILLMKYSGIDGQLLSGTDASTAFCQQCKSSHPAAVAGRCFMSASIANKYHEERYSQDMSGSASGHQERSSLEYPGVG